MGTGQSIFGRGKVEGRGRGEIRRRGNARQGGGNTPRNDDGPGMKTRVQSSKLI